MASKLEIVNRALTNIGVARIASLTAQNNVVRAVDAVWTQALDETLEAADWNFARSIKALVLLGDDDQVIPGYAYVYALPANCIRVWAIFDETHPQPSEPNKFERMRAPDSGEDCIATDVEDAYARYTYRVIDPTAYTPNFVKLLAIKLGAEICLDLTEDKQRAAGLEQMFAWKASAAMAANANSRKPKKEEYTGYVKSRG